MPTCSILLWALGICSTTTRWDWKINNVGRKWSQNRCTCKRGKWLSHNCNKTFRVHPRSCRRYCGQKFCSIWLSWLLEPLFAAIWPLLGGVRPRPHQWRKPQSHHNFVLFWIHLDNTKFSSIILDCILCIIYVLDRREIEYAVLQQQSCYYNTSELKITG
jgi:hypothetical protein